MCLLHYVQHVLLQAEQHILGKCAAILEFLLYYIMSLNVAGMWLNANVSPGW